MLLLSVPPLSCILLLSVFSTRHVQARKPLTKAELCFDSCHYVLQPVSFIDTNLTLPKAARACSGLKLSSLCLCTHVFCPLENVNGATSMHTFNQTCLLHTGSLLPPLAAVITNFTEGEIKGVRRLERQDAFRGEPMSEVTLPSNAFWDAAYGTMSAWDYEINTHFLYGWAMIYFWTFVVSIGLCFRVLTFIDGLLPAKHKEYTLLSDADSLSESPGAAGGRVFSNQSLWLRRHITVPALFGYHCSQPVWWCTIPPRMQSLTIAAFIFLNISLCCISYRTFLGNLYWPDVIHQYGRYISDRTGIIALLNLPIVWLFGLRNNFLMRLTGWDIGTYNNFHRWIARVATVEAIVHSLGYTFLIFRDGGWPYLMKFLHKPYFFYGELATIFMCFILVASFYPLRRHAYELFLILHIVFSVIVLVGMWFHVLPFGEEYLAFIWPCAAIWILDRLFRAGRIFAFDWRFWATKAETRYDPKSHTVRLVVPLTGCLYKPGPGTYYYIYVLDDSRFWESHPFTIAYVSGSEQETVDSTQLSSRFDTSRCSDSAPLTVAQRGRTPSEDEALLCSSQKSTRSMVFLIRPYNGFTSRLQTHQNPRVLVEGPYGHTQPLHDFAHVLFITGGTGIAVPLSYLDVLLASSRVVDVHIIWAVREQAFARDVIRTDLHAKLRSEKLRLAVHVTQRDQETMSEGNHSTKLNNNDRNDSVEDCVHLRDGRPDVSTEVQEAAKAADKQRLAVVACGPPQMADEARRAVVEVLGMGFGGVEYFEESFSW